MICDQSIATEPSFGYLPALASIESIKRAARLDGVRHLLEVFDQVSGHTLIDQFRGAAAREGNDRTTGEHRLDDN